MYFKKRGGQFGLLLIIEIAPTFSIYLYLVDTDLESELLINIVYFDKFVMIFNLFYLRSRF